MDIDKYYKILNIPKNSCKSEIKLAYKSLSKVVHPKNGGNKFLYNLVKEAFISLYYDTEFNHGNKSTLPNQPPNQPHHQIPNYRHPIREHPVYEVPKPMNNIKDIIDVIEPSKNIIDPIVSALPKNDPFANMWASTARITENLVKKM